MIATSSLGLVQCGTGSEKPTYYKDVAPIINASCVGCHSTGGIGPFSLTSYEDVKAEAHLISAEVSARVMPPWKPASGPAFVDDRRLSDAQIQTITSWIAQGMVEGDPADAPKVAPPQNQFRADATIQVPQPYTPNPAEGTDDYHCFAMDPKLTQDTAVTALKIEPGDKRVVHHVLVYAVQPADIPQLQQLEAAGDGNGYTCFGSSGVGNANLVGAWVPGTTATVFPAGTGIVLSAGTILVMQVHYNMLVVQNTTDQTTAQFQYAPSISVTPAYMIPLLNDTFSIPPGVTQTATEVFDTSKLNVPDGFEINVYGVAPHMHLHGTDINVQAEKISGENVNLIDIPQWQFAWQQMYFYQQPILFQKGDKFTLSCTYDNTAANQPIINGVQQPPKTLTWGEDTLDEMCLSFLYGTIAVQ